MTQAKKRSQGPFDHRRPVALTDEYGNVANFFGTGTDPDADADGIDMTAEAGDYDPPDTARSSDGTFLLRPMDEATVIMVQLPNGSNYKIGTAETTKFHCIAFDMKVIKVYKTGTTGKFKTIF